jgi:hypothetical protein
MGSCLEWLLDKPFRNRGSASRDKTFSHRVAKSSGSITLRQHHNGGLCKSLRGDSHPFALFDGKAVGEFLDEIQHHLTSGPHSGGG